MKKPYNKTYEKVTAAINKSTSWGRVADWYDAVVHSEGSYQRELILPNLLRMMNIQGGERVFDVACGQGFFANEFARAGAKVIASDISPELIDLARKNFDSSIDFLVSTADKSPFIADGTVDKVAIVLALQNIERAEQVLREVARVVKKGGTFFIVLNHPAFRVPGASDWGWDEKKGAQYRRVDRYIGEFKYKVQMHPGADPSEVTYSFHRPLQLYVKLLTRAGFAVTALEEWTSHKHSNSGPRAAAENKARAEFPLFMCVVGTKH